MDGFTDDFFGFFIPSVESDNLQRMQC